MFITKKFTIITVFCFKISVHKVFKRASLRAMKSYMESNLTG